jgi:MYXO-CTERM domain-containing protein
MLRQFLRPQIGRLIVEAFMTRLLKRRAFVVSVLALLGCTPQGADPAVQSRTGALTSAVEAGADPGDLDILFMIDNSSSMTELQMKMLTQDPSFMTVLQSLPNGLPNIHIAVVSSDMGAPGDSFGSIGCTMVGDDGAFQAAPQGSCSASTLASGASFISNVGGIRNYTGTLENTFGCIAQLGDKGCGFEHQLASVARALGADGALAPAQNAGFLRENAMLAIVLLTNEDDCSARANTQLFSIAVGGSNQQNIANALGPVANYRCNQFGHLCNDPTSATPTALIAPPLTPPVDAQGSTTNRTLNLTNCESNDTGTGLLTPVADVVAGIRALKADPDNQIVVGAIQPPVGPYTVAWLPEQNGQNTQPGELWPQIEHSCGALGGDDVNPLATQNPIDGSFGDPGVRIAQFVHAFGTNGVVTSICDPDYGAAFQLIVDRIKAHLYNTTSTGAAGAGGGAGGHGGSAAGAGGAGGSGSAGSGAAGTTGSGAAGSAGSGTAGSTGSGTAGGGGHAAGGAAGAAMTGVAGTTGSGAAGAPATGIGGSGQGTVDAGAGGAPTGAAGTGPSAGGAAGSAAGGGMNGSGGAPGAAAGTSGGGSPGGPGGTGGTTTSTGSSGCSCETGTSRPSGLGLVLLVAALAAVRRRRRSIVASPASRPSLP